MRREGKERSGNFWKKRKRRWDAERWNHNEMRERYIQKASITDLVRE